MRCVTGSSGDRQQTELELGDARFQEEEVSQTPCYFNKGCRSLESGPNNLAGVCTPWVVKSETSFCTAERSGVPVPEVLVVCPQTYALRLWPELGCGSELLDGSPRCLGL